MGILVTRRVLDRVVFRRLPKGTGADYLMREAEAAEGDSYERLECSGMGEGQESASMRLRTKIRQLAQFPGNPSGFAIVTDFRTTPVDIRYGGWPT